jgi:hypothetical protein
MWLLSTLAVWTTTRIARRVPGGPAAPLVPGLLLGSSILFSKGVEFRPDVPAMLLLTWALQRGLHFLEERHAGRCPTVGTWSPWILALCAGGATLFTQKAIVPVVALGGAAWLVESLACRALRWPVLLGWMLGGVVGGWSLVLLGYWWVGGAEALVESTVFQLVRWSVRSEKLPTFRATFASDLLTWWLATVGGGLVLAGPIVEWLSHRLAGRDVPMGPSGFSRDEAADGRVSPSTWRAEGTVSTVATLPRNSWDSTGMGPGRLVDGHSSAVPEVGRCSVTADRVLLATVLLAAGACVGSLVVVKATFPQYYLLWFPWLVLAAGAGARSLLNLGHPGWQRIAMGVGGVLLAGQLGWLARGWLRGEMGPFPHLTGENPPGLALLAVGIFWLAWGLGWRGAPALANHRHRVWAWGGALALGYGVCRQLDLLAWSNAAQVQAIEQLQAQVSPGGRILDGFTGWGALRPHAYRIWWLNEFSMGLISPAELERELLELFDQDPPDAVLDDENLQRLPRSVRDRIENEYEPVEPAPLRVRRSAFRR